RGGPGKALSLRRIHLNVDGATRVVIFGRHGITHTSISANGSSFNAVSADGVITFMLLARCVFCAVMALLTSTWGAMVTSRFGVITKTLVVIVCSPNWKRLVGV